tara:strand:+ start:307 stop:1170 length:864 start_codon:yes stop_codon:yes gene_type:complete
MFKMIKFKMPYLIAEIGINHNGNMRIVKKLIDNSKEAGFDAVKFQKRDIKLVYSKEMLESFRESPWGNTFYQQKKGLELTYKNYHEIDKYCKKLKIDWFASAWDLNSLKFLDQFKVKYHKIASAMIVDKTFLSEVAKRKKHTFISTGMSKLKDIETAVKIFRRAKCSFELMHCISDYPMEVKDANLLTINQLKRRFKINVGYSGHENGLAVSYAAYSLGISSLERHITIDRTMYGSDQAASLEFRGMRELVSVMKKMSVSYGQSKLGHITKNEKIIAKKLRSHLNVE